MTLMLMLAACGSDKVNIGEGDSATGDSSGWSSGIDPNGDDPPEVQSGKVWCTEGSNSSGDLFFVTVDARDGQGDDTLSSEYSRVIASTGSNEVFDESFLLCGSSGKCEGSWRSGDYGGYILCSTIDDFEYHTIIVDRDGHESDEFELEID
ncbi:MAG: hypothetical protein GY913_08430 [Proteobacteria bacterium]|nr:hypothetical protein [Pseudomonadota bacterium]MCP4916936.1 hypothetical protein [Pseudomonadota bacterium]